MANSGGRSKGKMSAREQAALHREKRGLTPEQRTDTAAVKRFDRAYSKSPGAKDDFVKLADIRARLGGTRESQDAAIRKMRVSGKYTLDTHEGLHTSPKFKADRERIMAAAITERGSRFVYISRR